MRISRSVTSFDAQQYDAAAIAKDGLRFNDTVRRDFDTLKATIKQGGST